MTSKIVVNNIEADSGVSTVTFGSKISSSEFVGPVVGNVTGNLTGNVTSSGISTFSDTVNVGAGKSIRLYGATSGYSEIIAAAGSASTTFTLPANGGSASQYLQTDGAGVLSWQTVSASNLTRATAVASTSGTEINFESLPTGIRRITLMLSAVSTNGSSHLTVQLGDSGGYETSSYIGKVTDNYGNYAAFSEGFRIVFDIGPTHVEHGSLTLENIDGNTWVCTGKMARGDGDNLYYFAGSKSLSGECDRIRLTTATGTPTFDAGTVNIIYEV